MYRERRSSRSRFFWGIVLLVFGAFALTVNLGIFDSREFWNYWPALFLILGLVQVAWPGTMRERLGGFWLIALGVYGFVSMFEMFGLHWGTSWPILLVALGIRIVLGGIFDHQQRLNGNGNQSGQHGSHNNNQGGQGGMS